MEKYLVKGRHAGKTTMVIEEVIQLNDADIFVRSSRGLHSLRFYHNAFRRHLIGSNIQAIYTSDIITVPTQKLKIHFVSNTQTILGVNNAIIFNV